MNRRELLEGLLLLIFGGRRKPAATMVAPPAIHVKLPNGSVVRYALAEYRAGEWRMYEVGEHGEIVDRLYLGEVRAHLPQAP